MDPQLIEKFVETNHELQMFIERHREALPCALVEKAEEVNNSVLKIWMDQV